MSEEVIEAFDEARERFSSDRVIADPVFRARFIKLCQERGNTSSEESLCRLLMNLRKAGRLSHLKSNRTQFNDCEYRFASEIAVRHLERRSQITLDDILCSPALVFEFDSTCEKIAPGFSPLRYRWAALSLRKSRSISPEIMSTKIRRALEVELIRSRQPAFNILGKL